MRVSESLAHMSLKTLFGKEKSELRNGFFLSTQFSPNNNGGKSNAEDFSVTKF